VNDEYQLWELKEHFWQINLWKRGWKITENSVIPPIFMDEEVLNHDKEIYENIIVEYQIVAIHVEVPKAERRRDLPGFYSIDRAVLEQ